MLKTALVGFILAIILMIGILWYGRLPVTYSCFRCGREVLPVECLLFTIGNDKNCPCCLNCYYEITAELDELDKDVTVITESPD